VASPTLTAAALVDELTAITCPVTVPLRCHGSPSSSGNLPPALAKVRREALQEARDAGRRVAWLAAQVRLTPGRIYQLTITRRGRHVGPGPSTAAKASVQTATPQTTSQEV
jgi:hypothetical protein